MGKRGPAPKPTKLRILHGDRSDRINTAEPKPSDVDIVPPAWLAADAVQVWETYAPDLRRTGVLTSWDVEAFAAWCDAVCRRARAVQELAGGKEVITVPVFNKNGDVTGERVTKNPWTLVLGEADAQVQRYGARFGLTPSDRAQLKIGGSDRDPAEDLLSG